MSSKPPGKKPPRGQMGNPYEGEHFWSGHRDYGQGDPQEKRLVYDPRRSPYACGPEKQAEIECFMNNLREFMRKEIFLVKRPSFVERPFFSTPRIILQQNIIVTAGGPAQVICNWPIESRQKLVVTAIGISYDPLTLVLNQEVLFWFAKGANATQVGQTVPFFVDQSAAAAALTGYETGKTTVVPGSMAKPWSLIESGVNLSFTGKTNVQFCAQNFGATDLTLCAMFALWEYWTPKADEFEGADKQT